MEKNCGKFEEKLSAYLDGQLPSGEMAEIAAHLETCEACSALLEKMRKLDDLAGGVHAEFDEAMMDDLADRISAGVEEVESEPAVDTEPKAKVIPLWYRYIAVAASIAVVFLIGRMAFDETDPDLKRHRIAPSILQESPSPDIPPHKPDESDADKKADEYISEDMRISDEEAIEPEAESKVEISRQKSALPVKPMDVDDAADKAAIPAPASDMVSQGADSKKAVRDEIVDEGLGEVSAVAVEPSAAEEQVAVGGRKKGKDSKSVGSAMKLMDDEAQEESAILTMDSLESIYFTYSSAFMDKTDKTDGKGVVFNAALQKSIARENMFLVLIDSVESISEKSKDYRRLESLYLMARANHDLYLQTNNRDYLNRAIQYRSALLEIINERLEEDIDNNLLIEYKSEIDNWRF